MVLIALPVPSSEADIATEICHVKIRVSNDVDFLYKSSAFYVLLDIIHDRFQQNRIESTCQRQAVTYFYIMYIKI